MQCSDSIFHELVILFLRERGLTLHSQNTPHFVNALQHPGAKVAAEARFKQKKLRELKKTKKGWMAFAHLLTCLCNPDPERGGILCV